MRFKHLNYPKHALIKFPLFINHLDILLRQNLRLTVSTKHYLPLMEFVSIEKDTS